MEAAGVATAAFQSSDRTGFFMVRCVSDLADEKKDSSHVRKWRSYACDAAASFTIALLKSGPIPLSEGDPHTKTKRVEVIIEGKFNEFTPERQHEIVEVLAALLHIDQSHIKILQVYQGSIVIILEMPDTAANRFYDMTAKRDFNLMNLGIRSVLVEGRNQLMLVDDTGDLPENEPVRLPTHDLIILSQAEYAAYRAKKKTDNRFSYELLRRALNEKNEEAWVAIYAQYQRLVAFWVDGPHDTVEDRVAETFTKFWIEGKRSVFRDKFENFRKALAYLQQIAFNVRNDLIRRPRPPQGEDIPIDDVPETMPDLHLEPVHDQVEMNELYQKSLLLMEDGKEKLVWKLALLGLTPRQIAQDYPDQFTGGVEEVYRIKERILLRLRGQHRLNELRGDLGRET